VGGAVSGININVQAVQALWAMVRVPITDHGQATILAGEIFNVSSETHGLNAKP
jgi:hypothetical protein